MRTYKCIDSFIDERGNRHYFGGHIDQTEYDSMEYEDRRHFIISTEQPKTYYVAPPMPDEDDSDSDT